MIRQGLGGVRANGLAMRVACPGTCTLRADVVSGRTRLASRTLRTSSRPRTVRVKLRKVRTRLQVALTDVRTGAKVTRSVTLRG